MDYYTRSHTISILEGADMHTIELPPYAPTLIESTRAIGYSLDAAIADIIDNSIAACSKNIDIFFFPVGDAYIAVLDNGNGMDASEIDVAMQYGSRNPLDVRATNDLGRFGLGLKTASLSQCRILTVISKKGDSIEGRRWDIDYVAKTGQWSLIVLDSDEMHTVPHFEALCQYESGTLIVWQELDRLKSGEINFEDVLGKKIDGVREHIALVFHRYLSGETGLKKIKISINNTAIVPFDPFLSGKSQQPMDDEILKIRGEKIIVRPYILPHTSKMTAEEIKRLGGKDGLRKQQGFYVYRNKRLLVWGTWFRMMRKGDLSKLARIQVDIPNTLDDLWTLDIKKSSALPPAEVRKNLELIIEKIAEKSKRTWTFRGKKETDDSIAHVWNRMKAAKGGFYYEINRDHPMVEQIRSNPESVSKLLESMLHLIESSLPLNQLYIDLNNDEQIKNDQSLSEKEIIQMLKDILAVQSSFEAQKRMIEMLESIEPYINYPNAVKAIKKEFGI